LFLIIDTALLTADSTKAVCSIKNINGGMSYAIDNDADGKKTKLKLKWTKAK
jgi:hypothetical protein